MQPVEGDTPSREKYYQGIKFYMPELVDTPELVEYEGMKKFWFELSIAIISQTGSKLIFDFANPNTDLQEIWGSVDDVSNGGSQPKSDSACRRQGNLHRYCFDR